MMTHVEGLGATTILDRSGTIYIWPEISIKWLFYNKLQVVQVINGFYYKKRAENCLDSKPALLLEDILW